MEEKPKRFIARIVEYAALFSLSVFLIKLAVGWLTEIWWIILIAAVIALAAVVGLRLWRNRGDDRW